MLNEDAKRFSVREITGGDNGTTYKIYDKRTFLCEAGSLKTARRIREALVLEELATKAGLEQTAA